MYDRPSFRRGGGAPRPSRPVGRIAGLAAKPPPPGSESWPRPWVQLKYFTYHPHVYDRFLGAVSPDAKAGDIVSVFDKEGRAFGAGLFHPTARVPLRVLQHGEEAASESLVDRLVDQAVDLRVRLGLGTDLERTDTYRVVSSDGDALSGLTVDRYADVLAVEVHCLGIWLRLGRILERLHARLGTKRSVVRVDPGIARMEGIRIADHPGDDVGTVRVREHGVRFEIDFRKGHKTGFFCDQRENRRRLAELVRGQRVLDVCCYTGGFSVAAMTTGGAEEVTCVDLDEDAVDQARTNGNLNRVRLKTVHADAFSWLRQAAQNGQRWPVVILDPPKLVERGDGMDAEEGLRRYEDLNQLAIAVVEPGGLFVTCSCSGRVEEAEFERIVIRAAHRRGRRLQFLDKTGAGPDHPVLSNCPESRYLKVLWARVP